MKWQEREIVNDVQQRSSAGYNSDMLQLGCIQANQTLPTNSLSLFWGSLWTILYIYVIKMQLWAQSSTESEEQ